MTKKKKLAKFCIQDLELMMKMTEINSSEMTEKSRPICTFDWTFLGEKRNSLLEQLYPSNLYATCRYELYVNVFGVARFVQSML